MATLALSVAGQFVGGMLGGPLGAMAGRALGALAGNAVDGMLFGERTSQPQADIRLQGSAEGGAIPRLYGWGRLAGNIIWARELERLGGEGGGAKGLGAGAEAEVAASFAVAFCEGTVQRLGRIWADGQLLETEGLTLRFYRGDEAQLPDGLIEATQGTAPAYRGLCYLVVEQLPLGRFGNRIPQLTVELCRVIGDLEPAIRAVTVIPGATEFGYDPQPRLRLLGPGWTESENAHLAAAISDWTWSIDELTALCPNLEHVALVVAWFGDDLRCEQCQIGPRVEAAGRQVEGVTWSVAGLGREQVPVVSQHDGGPAYGGTPSDDAVRAAIADLQTRGLTVTLYPLVMMDIPAGNGLPDPHGWGEQAAYPWRGRTTCMPAPGQSGSPDQSSLATTQVEGFAARYRQMIMHYAALAAEAGAETLVIGSEMRGLTTVRGAGNSFPFVDALVALAAELRLAHGPALKLTYAADWREWNGYQPDGEKFFHLDPLWASPAIDAVGIDNYMPVGDWRDGDGHWDAQSWPSSYDLDYLASNISGGEGHAWYYASGADRLTQQRSPITDGAHGEPWVWRFKDIRNWWSNLHHDRPGGIRNGSPTAWVPGSKPIWFTELGCAAVDKGANQPNIFGDSKSAEDGRPYFSAGTPDDLMQRQVLRAHLRHWADPAHNPPGMVAIDRIYLWTWDARPYPAFPGLAEVWSDGINHSTGHWLTGRLGGFGSDELANTIGADGDVAITGTAAAPLLIGYTVAANGSVRDALEPVLQATGQTWRNGADGLQLHGVGDGPVITLNPDMLAQEDRAVLARRRIDPAERPGRLALSFVDRERDYATGTTTAIAGEGPLQSHGMPVAFAPAGSRLAAERLLDAARARTDTLEFALLPTMLHLEPGDRFTLVGQKDGPFEIAEVRDGLTRRVTARSLPRAEAIAVDVDRRPGAPLGVATRSAPVLVTAHLPPRPDDPGRSRLVIGGYAVPWPGALQVTEEITGTPLLELPNAATMGVLLAPLAVADSGAWDESSLLEVLLFGGHLAAVSDAAVLAGSNRLAVAGPDGRWEVLGFAQAELIGPRRYGLSRLQRGLDGTAPTASVVGASVVLLDGRAGEIAVLPSWLGAERLLRVFAGPADLMGTLLHADLATPL